MQSSSVPPSLQTGIFLYNRTGIYDGDSCILSNNSAAVGDVDLDSRYGIACHKPSSLHIATWYYPTGNRASQERNNYIFSSTLLNGDEEIRRTTNFNRQSEGVYACVITDEDGINEFLYIGVYQTIRSQFSNVNLGISSFQDSTGAYLLLSCLSTGLPATRVSWYFNDEPITVGDQVQLIPNRINTVYQSLLRIRSDELPEHMLEPGVCRCMVEAETSSANATRTLTSLTGKIINRRITHIQ